MSVTPQTPWISLIGIGEDGLDGLSPGALKALERAEVILGGDRHHGLAERFSATRMTWPSPFDAMVDAILAHRGRPFAILTTGDPLWYSVGARLLKAIPADQMEIFPQLSAFQWAAARLGWSLADLTTATVHGRAVEQVIPHFAPNRRMLLLTRDGDTPAEVAALLRAHGYGASSLSVLGALGGARETRHDGTAQDAWTNMPAFHVLAVTCRVEGGTVPLAPGPGLPDAAFVQDGKMTKAEVRAVSVAALAPFPGASLWDLGCGCGSVAVEFLRLARDGEAVGVDHNAARLAMARENATRLGTPRLRLIEGRVPQALEGLAQPDAVFIGGGLSVAAVEASLAALPAHGRLVANAVTLESEALLIDLHATHGGRLTKLSISRAEPVGPFRGWRALMPVTQWVWTR
ncbi:MAG: precorrin-6y C5,15-methyltransferase (decarboxylating) subunit CbiE [Pseudomonadota bacterium]